MNTIDIFLQNDESPTPIHIPLTLGMTLGELKAELIKRKLATPDCDLFVENEDAPLDEKTQLSELKHKPLKIHANRCKRVEVKVTFSGRTIDHKFAPGTTVAKVHRWSTQEFGLTPDDASDHVLQLKGTHDRPSTATHIGSLARDCELALDLLPNERVQGHHGAR